MTNDQRRSNRVADDLSIKLTLCKGFKGPVLAGPTDGKLENFSSAGAGLLIPKIFVDDYHLFYSPKDHPEHILYLTFILSDDDEKNMPVPVRPIWFDRIQSGESNYFKMGVEFRMNVEFTFPCSDEEMKHLIRTVSLKQKERKSWLSGFFDRLTVLGGKKD